MARRNVEQDRAYAGQLNADPTVQAILRGDLPTLHRVIGELFPGQDPTALIAQYRQSAAATPYDRFTPYAGQHANPFSVLAEQYMNHQQGRALTDLGPYRITGTPSGQFKEQDYTSAWDVIKPLAIAAGSALGAGALINGPSWLGIGSAGAKVPTPTGTPGGVDDIYANLGKEAAGGGIGAVLKKIWPALAAAGIPLAARAAGAFGGGPSTSPANLPPELGQLLGEAMSRVASQRPLFEATNRQALAGLPTYAKRG